MLCSPRQPTQDFSVFLKIFPNLKNVGQLWHKTCINPMEPVILQVEKGTDVGNTQKIKKDYDDLAQRGCGVS